MNCLIMNFEKEGKSMTIIERDIEFYTAMAEQHKTDLRRCTPNDEQKHRERMIHACAVYHALLKYQEKIQ